MSNEDYSMYLPILLLEMWEQEQLTPEQAIGQILLRQRNHEERLRHLERLANLPPQAT